MNAQGIESLAQAGRFGDTELIHATKGEVVIPPTILKKNPSLVQAIRAELAKEDTSLDEVTVGSQLASVNPKTGLQEFFIKSLFKKIKKVGSKLVRGAKKVFKKVAPVGLGLLIPGVGKFLGSGLGSLGKFLNIPEGIGMNLLGGKGLLETAAGVRSAITGGIGSLFGGGSQDYTIKAGDTLSDIAAANNTTVEALAKANNITDPSKIFAGQNLSIPGSKNIFSRVGDFVGGLDGTPGFQLSDISAGLGSLREGFQNTTSLDPALLALAKYYGDATEKALEKESGGMGDIRQSLRPDLALNTYGGIGGFDLGYAEGGEVMDMRAGGESIGPGTGTSDDIPAMLSDGEFVMTAKANLGAGSVGLKKGKGGIMELVPQGEPDRQRGADNMMTLMRYFEARS